MTDKTPRLANVIGLGLIGGSIAAGLRQRGWRVHGDDASADTVERAVTGGVIDAAGLAADAEITFVAVPVSSVGEQVHRALAATTGVVTDVGSVKATVCAACQHERFVGSHPMAGSELDGLDGADPEMFNGAVWVVTPTADTDDVTLSRVTGVLRVLQAEVVALTPEHHDQVVAVVSHVPHLAAATLMQLAVARAEEHAPLLRLAAGGFRDMTRIAAGRPDIWIDVCAANRTAIVGALDELIDGLRRIRAVVGDEAGAQLHALLTEAREARTNLPGSVAHPERLVEVRIRIPDRAGAAAEVFTLAADLGVNISDFEVVHLAEGNRGVAVVLIDADSSEVFRGGLLARGFKPSMRALT